MGRLAQDLQTLPNVISIGRIFLIYACYALWLSGYQITALGCGFVAGIGDYLDGWLARRMGLASDLGGIVDQLSDLIVESSSILFAIYLEVLPAWVAPAYLVREFVVISARNLALSRGWTLRSRIWGKLKTNFLHYALFVMFIAMADFTPAALDAFLGPLALFGVFAGLGLSYLSGAFYVVELARLYDGEEGSPPPA